MTQAISANSVIIAQNEVSGLHPDIAYDGFWNVVYAYEYSDISYPYNTCIFSGSNNYLDFIPSPFVYWMDVALNPIDFTYPSLEFKCHVDDDPNNPWFIGTAG